MTTVTMTGKIEIYVDGSQEEKDSFFDFFWKNSKGYVKALNLVYKQLVFEELIKDTIEKVDQGYAEREEGIQNRIEKLACTDPTDQKKLDKAKAELSKLRNEKNKEAREMLTQAMGLRSRTRTRDVAEKLDFDFGDFTGSADMKTSKDFGSDFIGIVTGQKTPRIYKNRSKYGSLPFRDRDIKIHKNDKFYIYLPKGSRFKVNLSSEPRKARDVASILQHIMDGDYRLSQSNPIFDGRKLFFNRTRQKSPILYKWVMNAVRCRGYR